MSRLTYSKAFDEIDPEGDLQIDAEEAIAAQLFDDWGEFTLFWHACRIIARIGMDFFPQEDPTIETYMRLVQDVYDFLTRWQPALESEAGPDEDEAAQAGRDILILVFSRLKPEYTQSAVS
jgi:hypothetical protein